MANERIPRPLSRIDAIAPISSRSPHSGYALIPFPYNLATSLDQLS